MTPVRHGKSKHGAKAKSQRDVEEKNDDEQRALGERIEGEDADDELPPPLEQQRPANHPTTEVAAGNPAPTAAETGYDVGEAEEPEQAEASTSGNAADLPASAASVATLTTAVQQLAMMVAELRAANRASSSTYEGVITRFSSSINGMNMMLAEMTMNVITMEMTMIAMVMEMTTTVVTMVVALVRSTVDGEAMSAKSTVEIMLQANEEAARVEEVTLMADPVDEVGGGVEQDVVRVAEDPVMVHHLRAAVMITPTTSPGTMTTGTVGVAT
ncbi:hypothetical protein PF011_g21619 [Phytophthora fragariae]|uniref:Uncharacterized protein n=3 Tax=Phytophthora fragariae TaxID=53985 RepID=A0A6A3IP02_9STRA|nr:hypothetical protein PF011_g21619 [Phytophthora fragariae]